MLVSEVDVDILRTHANTQTLSGCAAPSLSDLVQNRQIRLVWNAYSLSYTDEKYRTSQISVWTMGFETGKTGKTDGQTNRLRLSQLFDWPNICWRKFWKMNFAGGCDDIRNVSNIVISCIFTHPIDIALMFIHNNIYINDANSNSNTFPFASHESSPRIHRVNMVLLK